MCLARSEGKSEDWSEEEEKRQSLFWDFERGDGIVIDEKALRVFIYIGGKTPREEEQW